jgi:butyrate kinase
MAERILVINPGSTSTKIAVYDGMSLLLSTTIEHPAAALQACRAVSDQFDMRYSMLCDTLRQGGIMVEQLDFIMARGGALRPIHGGVWGISPLMLDELRTATWADHASNLGALMAHALAAGHGIPTAIVDPPVVDELDEVARISGHPAFQRRSRLHALNQKAVARRAAAELGLAYPVARLVVAHLGGGISVGVHRDGRIVDVNDAYDGDGPFSPERSGGLPAGQVAKLCLSGSIDPGTIKRMLVGEGGLYAYLGTSDVREALRRMAGGDGRAALVVEAMVYQVAKEIGAAATVLEGQLDGIVLTGSIMHSDWFRERLVRRIAFLGRLFIYPGEDELGALRDAALRVLQGTEPVQSYE